MISLTHVYLKLITLDEVLPFQTYILSAAIVSWFLTPRRRLCSGRGKYPVCLVEVGGHIPRPLRESLGMRLVKAEWSVAWALLPLCVQSHCQ